jgi:hypothetical protein
MPRKPMMVMAFGVMRLASTARRNARFSGERCRGAPDWVMVPMGPSSAGCDRWARPGAK